nr:EAL domain-containing protein [uncultured Albidiferax sp.]
MIAAELSRRYSVIGVEMNLVWPPDGIAVGLVLAYGLRMVPVIGAGVMVWHMQRGIPLSESLVGAFALMLALLVVCWLRKREHDRPHEANPVTACIRYHFLILLPAICILTALGCWQFMLAEMPSRHGLAQIVLVMGISELFGILLFSKLTELLVRALDQPGRKSLVSLQWWQAWWFVILGTLVAIGDAADHAKFGGLGSSVRYAVFPLVAWAAFSGRPLFVHVATALAALALLWLTPTDLPDTEWAFLILDQAVLVVCLAGLGFFASAAMEHRRVMESNLQELAHIDPLTGMLNGHGLAVCLEAPGAQQLLIGIEVCNMGQIEDLIGMTSARQIEEDIAKLLRDQLPDATLLSRVKDGFFVVTLPPGQPSDESINRLRQILAGRRYVLGEQGVRIRVALSAIDTRTSTVKRDEILAALILACRVAGDSDDRGQVDAGDAPEILMRARQEQLSRAESLREALRNRAANATDGVGLWLACQPIRAARDGLKDLGIEVLLRWNTAPGIPSAPSEFLPLAERHGLMPQVDRWVIAQVVQALVNRGAGELTLEKISINLSGSSMSDTRLLEYIADAIRAIGFPASQFCFEVTETSSIAERTQAISLLSALRALGAQTSLDDFGTGLATFDYLKSLPLDYLKIDGSFVRDIVTSRVDQRIIMATCEVATAMGLKTVAEFVETPSQRTLLAAYGVDYVQGYGIGVPMPLDDYLAHRYEASKDEVNAGGA